MERTYFLTTNKIGFSEWRREDMALAELLWGNPLVTRYICASGHFSKNEIAARLKKEMDSVSVQGAISHSILANF